MEDFIIFAALCCILGAWTLFSLTMAILPEKRTRKAAAVRQIQPQIQQQMSAKAETIEPAPQLVHAS